jgi:hypothetical protein
MELIPRYSTLNTLFAHTKDSNDILDRSNIFLKCESVEYGQIVIMAKIELLIENGDIFSISALTVKEIFPIERCQSQLLLTSATIKGQPEYENECVISLNQNIFSLVPQYIKNQL